MRLLLSLFPLLIVAYLYVGSKIYVSTAVVLGLSRATLFPYLGGVLIICSLYPLLLIVLKTIAPEKVELVLAGRSKIIDMLAWPFGFGAILAAEVSPWLLLIDFLKLPFHPLYKPLKESWIHYEYYVVFGFLAAYSVYVIFRILLDTFLIRVSKTTVKFDNLRGKIDGLRIVHISDFLLDKRTRVRRLKRYLKKVSKLAPDLVIFTGDLAASNEDLLQEAALLLGKVKSGCGVVACLGDHDALIGSEKVMNILLTHNIAVWQDANQFVKLGNDRLLLTFITNHYREKTNLDTLNYLMGQQPRGVLDIAITHQPSESMIELVAERGYHFFFAGHTHGGQIVLKLFGKAVTLAKVETPYYNRGRLVQNMFTNINNGLGFALMPFRFRAPAQVCLFVVGNRRR